MSNVPAPAPPRCIITTHSPTGRAIIGVDSPLAMIPPAGSEGKAAVGTGWVSSQFPASNEKEGELMHFEEVKGNAHPNGSVVRFVDVAPDQVGPLHFTDTLDYAIVLQGEIVMELDDHLEVTAKSQDFIVQRGTVHAWHNRSKTEWCRMLFVVLPAKEILVDGKVRSQPLAQS